MAIGCATARLAERPSAEQDVAAAFRAVLTVVHLGSEVTVVAAPGLGEDVLRGLRLVRPVVEQKDVPSMDAQGLAGLPENHFRVYALRIAGAKAIFEGTLGPVPPGPPALNCGQGHQVELERTDTGWKPGKTVFIMC